MRTPGYVEIREGIEAGEHVVVSGGGRLTPGSEVRATLQERRQQRGAGDRPIRLPADTAEKPAAH